MSNIQGIDKQVAQQKKLRHKRKKEENSERINRLEIITNETATSTSTAVNIEIQKLAQIVDVIELIEESHKDKDWLLQQIKQNKIKVTIRPTMSVAAILKACPVNFITYLLNIMNLKELEEFEGPPPLTVTYHWFFTDIVAGSDPTITTNEQARKIIVLNQLIERTAVFRQSNSDTTLILPTGDGMAIGFDDSAEKPLKLALEVHKNLSRYNSLKKNEKDKLFIRIGIESGPVYLIKDLNGRENAWGPGIIMARRVMDLAGDMNIVASAKIVNDIKTLRPEYKNLLHPVGDYAIKHGEKILLYNIYGEGFGSKKNPPRKDKVQKSTALEENQRARSKFIFNNIEITLQVTNVATMETHHTMLWNMINISDQPVDRIFYYLVGDTPRTFPDLHVTVKDEENRECDIISLNVNKPYQKEFYVGLKKPMKPNEKRRHVTLEYDWEEPDRHYMYTLASECKNFKYTLNVPKELEINQKVLIVDRGSGDKRYATPAIVKYLDDETEVTWSGSNLKIHDTYRFDW